MTIFKREFIRVVLVASIMSICALSNVTYAFSLGIPAEIRAQIGYMPEAFGVIATVNVCALCIIRHLRKNLHLKKGQ